MKTDPQNGAIPPRPDNQQSVEESRRATQQNQERNRPDQNQKGQAGQRDVKNDSSRPGYGMDKEYE